MRRDHLPEFAPRALDYTEYMLWRSSLVSRGGTAIAMVSVHEGSLTEAAVRQAWRLLCLRHPMLGATVEEGPNGPRFAPLPAFPAPTVWETASAGVAEELIALAGEVEFPPGGPLFRCCALTNAPLGRHAVLVVANHAAADGAACVSLLREFGDLLSARDRGEGRGGEANRALPPSIAESLLGGDKRWRFAQHAAIELTRRYHTASIPHETRAPVGARRTRRLLAVADIASSRAILDRASAEGGLTAFLTAGLLRAQFMHMRGRGLIGGRAKLPLLVPVDLRPLVGRDAVRNRAISMSTWVYTSSVRLESGTPQALASHRVREAMEPVAGAAAIDRLLNWYSPWMIRRATAQLVGADRHAGGYTTHVGRLVSDREGPLRRVFLYGFMQMRHCINALQGGSIIQNGRLAIGLNYCEPAVSADSAQSIFRDYLVEIGADPYAAQVADYDESVSRLNMRARAAA